VFEFGGEATNVAVSDEGRLAIAANDAVIHVFDREAASAEPRILAGHEPRDPGGLPVLKFSPDGRHLLSIGWDKTLRRWDLSGPCIQPETVELSEIFVTDAAFSPDGRWLVTARWSAPTLLWNVFDLESGGTEWEAAANARTRVFSPDSRWLSVVNAEGNLWLKDMEAGETIKLASLDPRNHVLAFSPDSKQLFAAGNEPKGYLWDLVKIRRRPDVIGVGNYPIKNVVYSPGGEHIVTGSRGLLTIWQTDDPEDAPPVAIAGHGTAFDESVFFDKGRKLATASGPAVPLWSFDNPHVGSTVVDRVAPGSLKQIRRSGGALSSLEGKTLGGVANAAAFSSDDRWFAVALEREYVAVVNLSEPDQPITRLGPHGYDVTALAFGGNGQTLITAGAHFNLKIWHMQALERDPIQLPSVESQHERSVAALAASPDGRWVAAGAAFGEVTVWNTLKADDAPKLLHEHEGWVVSVAFSGEGQWLLTSGEDGTAKVWDTRDFDAPPRTLRHAEAAVRAKFSPGGETVATAGQDAAARLWRITEPGRPPRVLLEHKDSIIDMAFSPDNEWLATAGEDGRGMVRAITGDHRGAVDDFEAYVEAQSGNSDRAESVVLRRSWIAQLEQNRNPITREVPDELREHEKGFISLSRCTEKRP